MSLSPQSGSIEASAAVCTPGSAAARASSAIVEGDQRLAGRIPVACGVTHRADQHARGIEAEVRRLQARRRSAAAGRCRPAAPARAQSPRRPGRGATRCRRRRRSAAAALLQRSGRASAARPAAPGTRPNSRPVASETAAVNASTGGRSATLVDRAAGSTGTTAAQRGHAPRADEQPERAAERGEQQALGEQLADDAAAPRAEREPDGDLAAAGPTRARAAGWRRWRRRSAARSRPRQQHAAATTACRRRSARAAVAARVTPRLESGWPAGAARDRACAAARACSQRRRRRRAGPNVSQDHHAARRRRRFNRPGRQISASGDDHRPEPLRASRRRSRAARRRASPPGRSPPDRPPNRRSHSPWEMIATRAPPARRRLR